MIRRATVRGWSSAAALALVLAFVPGEHSAKALSATAALSIGTSVNIRCTILTSGVNFGSYDVTGNNAVLPLDATGAVSLNCTAGANVDIRLGQGSFPGPGSTNANPRRRLANGGAHLNYNLYEDAAYTTVWDNVAKGLKGGKVFPVNIPVYGRAPAGQNVPSGSYADSVVATISF